MSNGGNPQLHTQPVKTLSDAEKVRVRGELAQISAAHNITYTLGRQGGEYKIMLGPFVCDRVDLVTRSKRRAFLVVSGVEWQSNVE